MKKILIGMLLVARLGYAQNLVVTGTIADAKSGTPLPYAYVQIKGKALGTVTDPKGKFKLTVPKSLQQETLIFSYVGYVTQQQKIASLSSPVNIKLATDTKMLEEVVIEPEKMIGPKALLRKVIKNIPKNYQTDTVFAKAYYRELLKENGFYIKYADAVVELQSLPYTGEDYKYKQYDFGDFNMTTLGYSSFYGGSRLHRYHFYSRTLKGENAKVVDSRSSDNLTQERMDANIEGGPLNLVGRDRIKYLEEFMNLNKKGKFIYSVSEQETEAHTWEYILSFKSKYDPEYIAKKEARKTKKNKPLRLWMSSSYFLEGKLHIDQETFAVTNIHFNVPQHLKKYICGYDTMAIKHFDYKVDLNYKKFNNKYSLAYVRMEDEFIFVDTIEDETTPYSAVSELFVQEVGLYRTQPFPKDSLFANNSFNQLFDLPLSYHPDFWNNFTKANPQFSIAEEVRQQMENNHPLEYQFAAKHKKDTTLKPPIAKIKPTTYTLHGKTYTDNYAWLKDTKAPLYNPEVMEYIDAENNYTRNYFIPLRKNERMLYREMLSRIEKEYTSLPEQIRNYKYYVEYGFEEEYPIYTRTNLDSTQREILIDTRQLAKKYDYYAASFPRPSPNDMRIAFFENTTGTSKSTLKIKDLTTGQLLADSVTSASDFRWISNQAYIYTELEKKTNRSYLVKLHKLGTPQKTDRLLFEEKDKKFSVQISTNKLENIMLVTTASSTTSEVYYFYTNEISPKLKLLYPRQQNILYYVTQADDKFYIRTNELTKNFSLVRVDTTQPAKANWEVVIANKGNRLLQSVDILKNFMIATYLENAQPSIEITDRTTQKTHTVKFKKDIYMAAALRPRSYYTDSIRIVYSTPKTPLITYSYQMKTQEKTVLKKQKLPFPVATYRLKVERVMVKARDGEEIPLTLIYRKFNAKKELDHRKVFITGYGSYGAPLTVGFNANIYPLLDRGFTIAYAHVRGGSDKGYQWYEDGKMFNKKNTFYDFIDCTQYLIDNEYVLKGNIVAEGGSAGGLLMGAVANMAPDLYKLIILDVPFVDVINTMLDDKLPLTVGEYEEWGNPNVKKEFKYIKSYSPYDNVTAQNYPTMLFTTGLSDQQVGYWEPAKMVAKLRATKTDTNELLLDTRLHSGHGGQAGRFDYIRTLAKHYALIIELFVQDEKDKDELTAKQ